MLLAAIAYYILQSIIKTSEGSDSKLVAVLGGDYKGKLSPVLYGLAIMVAFIKPAISGGIYALVALMWLIPDRRIELMIEEGGHSRSTLES